MIIVLGVLLLLLTACSKGAEVEDKLNQYKGVVPQEDEDPTVFVREEAEEDKNETVDWEPEETTEEAEIPEEPKFEGEPECTTDSKGVVRLIYPDGSKKVYRHDCQPNGIVLKYRCEDNKVVDKAVVCSSGQCKPGPYGDSCIL